MKRLIARFIKDERGATAIEYGLIVGLVALAITVGAGKLGTELDASFERLSVKVKGWFTT
ncbi:MULTISPECIES: Flp family type IVb pilin [Cupriavidus]|uniref:Pilus assembly protein n=1 Tax=Cupriavidus taiwanensis TaxID=164546 RepID=A0A375FFQ3_9BURK|nr:MULTISPECIES: Flp family type IVb pilin [Cupriavidus]MEC3767570.1 Flp family type IVb pilin [Cupriavidus sp. SS-3]UDM52105.1 Flp family type IVb pilin [Cupriavidus sp. MP-37]SPA33945.1 putative Flp/Fap pilin component [Cupriavidus taiwanensis]SPA55311.1 putative Flp/Fap pilin component [Cupriavidus taiwanensis]SPD66565.1 Pilus assembly protein [Cupriavidus taiwanensis]